jgi:hypothetical protein
VTIHEKTYIKTTETRDNLKKGRIFAAKEIALDFFCLFFKI